MRGRLARYLCLLLVMMMAIMISPLSALAESAKLENGNIVETHKSETAMQTLDYKGFQYQEENDRITIVSFNGELSESKSLEIPENINGKNVTEIEKEAFKDNHNIKEVIIPKEISSIDKTAFDGCDNLEKITVSKDNVTYYDNEGKLYKKENQELLISPLSWKSLESNTTQSSNTTVEKNKTAAENPVISTMESIPALSENANMDQQIVVIYNNSSEINVSSLALDMNEVKAGENVSDRVDVLELNENVNPDDVINQLSKNSNVMAVSRNQKIEISSLPNDTYIANGYEWQFQKVGADNTWNAVSNTTPVVVAVLDTGLNLAHQDLQGRTVTGYDYYTKSASVIDLMGHGTMVSGCIAALTNNGVGVAGIAGSANIKIAPYRVGGSTADDRYLNGAYIDAALMAAADRSDVRVINMSFGSYGYDSAEAAAINYAKNKGKILVAAAGNEGNNATYQGQLSYPASFDGVISVAATDSSNVRAYFSQYNSMVDLAAPGSYVYTTLKTGGYGFVSGTSFSSPITAAACAVLLADEPSLSATAVENTLKTTATDLGASGRDNYYGYGLVQVDDALNYVRAQNPLQVKSFSAAPIGKQYVSSSIQVSAEGTGGKAPYQYKFSYTVDGNTIVFKNFSTSPSASYIPAKAGSYQLSVEIKDARGVTVTQNISNYAVVASPTVTSFTADKTSGQLTGTAINLKVVGSGGMSPVNYKFYYRLGTVTTTVKEYSTDDSAVFTPAQAGLYTLCVDMKDAGGKISTKTITNYNIVNPLSVKTFTTSKSTDQGIGTSIILTSTGSDGKTPYQYQFSYQLNGATTIISSYSNLNTATFKPSAAGTYTLIAEIKDGAGKTAIKKIENYKILPDPVVKSFTAIAPSGQGVNTSIGLTAVGDQGKTPYQYRFYYKLGLNTVTIQNFSTLDKATFKPLAAGTYTLCVDIKDANGKIATGSINNFVVYPSPAVKSFTVDKASGQYVNTSLVMNAEGTGGTGPYTYFFYYKLGTSTDKVSIQNSSLQSVTFNPTQAGIYTLCVDIKDAHNVVATRSIANFNVIANPSVKSFTTSKQSPQLVNTIIYLNAMGDGGKAPYQYQYSINDGTTTTIIRSYSTVYTAIFKPTKAGTYKLIVDIKDAGGKTVRQTIDNYMIK